MCAGEKSRCLHLPDSQIALVYVATAFTLCRVHSRADSAGGGSGGSGGVSVSRFQKNCSDSPK